MVVGGGPLATERTQGMVASSARVVVVTRSPSDELVALGRAGAVLLVERRVEGEDLAGAFVAVHTREDGTADEIAGEVDLLWTYATNHGVLFAALDDVPHCMFGAASTIRRGDLRITVSTAGQAPALAKRMRRDLEEAYDGAYGDLVAALAVARQEALPRDIPFATWARRWEEALEDLDGLLALVRAGDTDEVVRRVLAVVRPG